MTDLTGHSFTPIKNAVLILAFSIQIKSLYDFYNYPIFFCIVSSITTLCINHTSFDRMYIRISFHYPSLSIRSRNINAIIPRKFHDTIQASEAMP